MTDIQGYVFLRRKPVELMTGEMAGATVEYWPHQVVSLKETDGWGWRPVEHMVGSGIMVPTSADPTDVKELVVLRPAAAAPTGTGVEGDGGPATAVPASPHAEIPTSTATLTYPRHVGGGLFQLSDGSQVKGRTKAVAAEAALGV